MTNAKSLKRALFSSAVALLLCFTMLVGTTFAWFTDSAASNGNKIQAGVLDVDLYHHTAAGATDISDSKLPVIPADIKWEPGYTEVVYLSIRNNGNLALKYKVAIDVKEPANTQDSLTQALVYSITPNAEFTTVAANKPVWDNAKGIAVELGTNIAKFDASTEVVDMTLEPGQEHFFALSVHMLETAGNEFMNESITFDIRVLAGQLTSEEDSFGPNYDAFAEYPGKGFAPAITGNQAGAEVQVVNDQGYKVGSVVIPAAAATAGANLSVEIQESDYKTNVTVAQGSTTKAFEVKVEGVKEGNTVPMKTSLRIEPNLDPATVQVYHYNELIDSTYDWNTGYVYFETTSFSPFTVVYNPTTVEMPGASDAPVGGVTDPFAVGKATVTMDKAFQEYLDVRTYDLNETPNYKEGLIWGSFAGWAPNPSINEEPKLECAFLFDSVKLNESYANWACDFYISADKDIGVDQIFLGGYYELFGRWVGFHNGTTTLKAGEELALLGSVVTNDWTYAMIAENVDNFVCGVADVNNALKGVTFTVSLRLTNPVNGNSFDVATVTYTFGSENPIAE